VLIAKALRCAQLRDTQQITRKQRVHVFMFALKAPRDTQQVTRKQHVGIVMLALKTPL